MIVNKMDTADIFGFDIDAASSRARELNPDIKIFPVSAKSGAGIDELCDWLRSYYENNNP